ncbi:MAG: UDP-glucose 4-epimerase GalE [Planctomycetota bacterium]|jgi:UDP-glucose-4-epimerase GalE
MNVLVTGGAGYIGSCTVRQLVQNGYRVSVLDDMSTGHRDSVPGVKVFEADLVNSDLDEILEASGARAVIHFAGRALVPESLRAPDGYYATNLEGGRRLLEAMRRVGIHNLVFSSTCAVYGVPTDQGPIGEETEKRPISPYGRSKLAFEWVLADYCAAYGFAGTALRYFNAAGAEDDATHGEDHDPETHLIPRILGAARGGHAFQLYGSDYPTPDGTCIRDYVHVSDLARAHELALKALMPGRMQAFNIGTGRGSSIREVLAAVERITGETVQVDEAARRPGDPPRLVADASRAAAELGFTAEKYLDAIISSAWAWHGKNPAGYTADTEEERRSAARRARFGAIATSLGVIDQPKLEEALALQQELRRRGDGHKLIGLILLELGYLDTSGLVLVLKAMAEDE